MACLRRTLEICGMIKGILTRLLFAIHGFVCIWRVVVIKKNLLYWCLTGTLALMIAETVFTLKKKRDKEWKWFCPCVFLYLASTVPAIWFLELDLLERRFAALETGTQNQNKTYYEKLTVWEGKFELAINMVPDDWAKILEQILLLSLIVGRWFLPKGDLTREQLSQLLLVYIGMAADIIELFEAFKENEVMYNWMLTIVILSLWSASLIQFTFVVTITKGRKPRVALTKESSELLLGSSDSCLCCRTASLAIITTIILQDGPFLVLRMLLIVKYNVVSYTNIFFTAKNTLVIVLQLYRLCVLRCGGKSNSKFKKAQEEYALWQLKMHSSILAQQASEDLKKLEESSTSVINIECETSGDHGEPDEPISNEVDSVPVASSSRDNSENGLPMMKISSKDELVDIEGVPSSPLSYTVERETVVISNDGNVMTVLAGSDSNISQTSAGDVSVVSKGSVGEVPEKLQHG